MNNKDITPKVHLFGKLDKLSDTQLLMIVLPDGEKLQTSVGELKQFILEGVKEPEQQELTKEAIIKLFVKDSIFNVGIPLCILANVSIEKYKLPGVIYSDGERIRTFLKGKWVTLKTEDNV